MEKSHEIKQILIRKLTKILVFFSFMFAIFSISNTVVQAATLSFSKPAESYIVGSTFSVSVYVGSGGQSMNAASGVISFPSDKLEVVSLSKTGSIL